MFLIHVNGMCQVRQAPLVRSATGALCAPGERHAPRATGAPRASGAAGFRLHDSISDCDSGDDGGGDGLRG
eukprot:5923197-Pyramimonas_sp.AAC.1